MSHFDPLANVFTAGGFDTLESDATEAKAIVDATPALSSDALLGTVTPTSTARLFQEPHPDPGSFSGDRLDLSIPSLPLFVGVPNVNVPVQGFLGNCPLVAVLTAMMRVPSFRKAHGRGEIIASENLWFVSMRTRLPEEYTHALDLTVAPAVPAPEPEPRTLMTRGFSGRGIFKTSFFEGRIEHFEGASQHISILVSNGRTRSEEVTPVFYHWRGHPSAPAEIHYSRASTDCLWPSAIEKAFALLHSRGVPSYEPISQGLQLDTTMFNMTGFARQGLLDPGGSGVAPLTERDLKHFLVRHGTRPTILGSLSSPESPRIVADHTFAVVRFSGNVVRIINALEEPGTSDREIDVPFNELRANFGEIVQGPTKLGAAAERQELGIP